MTKFFTLLCSKVSQILMCIRITQGSCFNTDSDLIGLEQGTKFCISDKIPGDADAAGLDHILSSKALRF